MNAFAVLSTGRKIPLLGLGTWKSDPGKVVVCIAASVRSMNSNHGLDVVSAVALLLCWSERCNNKLYEVLTTKISYCHCIWYNHQKSGTFMAQGQTDEVMVAPECTLLNEMMAV